MGIDDFEKCYRFIDYKENQDSIRMMQAAAYPNMKREAGSSYFKSVKRLCFPEFFNESQAKETTALKDFVNGLK